jgi:hypothetical protein
MESTNSTPLLLKAFRPQQIESLTDTNLDDLVSSFGWEGRPLLARLLRLAFAIPARKFARQVLNFDDAIPRVGLVEAARQTLRNYVRDVRLFSAPLPAGPFLALSNHPGTVDTLALFAALNRPDLRIIAIDRPFLRAMPNTSDRLYYVYDNPGMRMALVRQVSAHLRSGGAALTFPAGKIEPDPHVYPGALDSLRGWTDSVGFFVRIAPETAILPVLVRGAVWEKTAQHPLARSRKNREEREKLAVALQLLAHVVLNKKPLDVTVQIGKPITVTDLGSRSTQALHEAVMTEMRCLIEIPPQGEGVSLL